MAYCYHCGSELPATITFERSSECPTCHRDLRVCKNCVHYSPESYQGCRETVPDPVIDKERGNFCDYFRIAAGKVQQGTTAKETKLRFEALFRDCPDE